MSTLLHGVRVLSFTHYLQGPACVQLLADMGADVIKIERRGGPYERAWSGLNSYLNGVSVFFMMAGRNQRSLEIDLTTSAGAEVIWKLIDTADVIVENFRPGVMERRGFGYQAVQARKPDIVYCSLTGWGPDGPMRTEPGQDLLTQSLSGLAQLNGGADAPPTPVGTALVDQHAAALGAMGVLGALVKRQRTGEGTKVDSNLLSAALDLQIEPLNYHLNGFPLYPRSTEGISSRFHQAPYGVFRTADAWITVSLTGTDKLSRALGDPWFSGLEPGALFDCREEVNARIAAVIRTRTFDDWAAIFSAEGVWFAPVNNYDDVVSHPQVAANRSILTFDHPRAGTVKVLGHPVLYDEQPPEFRRLPPDLGEHSVELLTQLGYSAEQIDALAHDGVIGGRREDNTQ
jgi:crotonobetainyl-CoA:carnitine CoA-transferase CaiB-like acyl-CoA transferase